MQPNYVTHLKLLWNPMLIMSLLLLGIGLLKDVMNLLAYVLDVFNKPICFISLRLYMCGFCLCSRMRHDNINQKQWLKSQNHLKWTATNQAIESFVIVLLHIGKALILGLWMLGVAYAKYVHYHYVDDLCLAIHLGIELGVQ